MRIVFMGTPDFAATALRSIMHHGMNVVAVYTQPPKPMGRGYEIKQSAAHQLAEQHTIPVFYPSSLRTAEAQTQLKQLRPDICVVAAYGFILPKAILDIPSMGCVNIHASLLPHWRGAAPIQHAILNGDTQTGITIMKMDEGMDTGDILLQRGIPIQSNATSEQLFYQLSTLGADLIVEYLSNPNAYTPIPQPTNGITMAPKIEKSMGRLDWTKPAIALERQLRAFTPWPGVFTYYNDTVLKIGSVNIIDQSHRDTPGTILNEHLHIACGHNTVLQLATLQRPGGKLLPFQEFLKGYPLKVGTHLM
jgi:methionyl-tRNA formyltransferase